MADDADRAHAAIETLLDAAIKRAKKPGGPRPTGYCLHCGEPLAEGLRWCDADCRDDWHRYQSFGSRHHQ